MTRTLLFGAGRMARCIQALAPEYPDIQLVAQVSRTPPKDSSQFGSIEFFTSLENAGGVLGESIDLLVDFSLPDGTGAAAEWCASNGVAMLSGVTGIGEEVQAALDKAAEAVPVLWAANLSLGINLMTGMLNDLAKFIDQSAKISISEAHHEGKRDAPSGTALFLARHLRPPAGAETGADPRRIGQAFPQIGFESRREGNIVGDHSVTIDLGDETLTLAHHARDRRLFARGALDAGLWLAGQPAGRYSAVDWIRSVTGAGF
jgi:4-hydroxy-tetrahydrodipicolinate reductase